MCTEPFGQRGSGSVTGGHDWVVGARAGTQLTREHSQARGAGGESLLGVAVPGWLAEPPWPRSAVAAV